MAARTVKIRHDEETRAKIKASQLINRLQDHVFNDAGVSATQMKAIEILLRKALPDLSNVTVGGDPDNPVKHSHAVEVTFVQAGEDK
jgi:BioD-like phosphotransacetylase family protein